MTDPKLTNEEKVFLANLPIEVRSAQSAFDKWITAYYPDAPGALKTKLRYAYKMGFIDSEKIFRDEK